MTLEFEDCYNNLKMDTRLVLFGKPRNDSILDKCGMTKLLDDLGIGSLINLPRVCYPDYVVEFYANLHRDKFDN